MSRQKKDIAFYISNAFLYDVLNNLFMLTPKVAP